VVDGELTASVLAAVAEATKQLAEAQQELRKTLEDLDNRDRADKTMISTVLRDVLTRVSAAQRKLASLAPDNPTE
jgi:hypothetical protein